MSKVINRLSEWLATFARKYTPDAFVIAVALTILVFILAFFFGNSSAFDLVKYWGNGFWALLTFGMQMCMVVFSGYLLAVSPPVKKLLDFIAGIPKTDAGVIAAMSLLSVILCWLNWGVGLIASAMMVGYFVQKRPTVDYRLLVASAYLGMGCSWHAGPSGSVPLLLATPGHFLSAKTGVLPTSETIFQLPCLLIVGVVSLVLVVLSVLMLPPPEKRVVVDNQRFPTHEEHKETATQPHTPAEKLENAKIINILIAVPAFLWLANYFWNSGLLLTLDVVNLLVLASAIILHRSPRELLREAEKGAKLLHGIILQFPLYAGMYGIIKDSGLAETISRLFISVSTEHTFPIIVFWYSSFLNYFVPSGGSKWVIEAPYLLEAAQHFGISTGKLAMSYAFGDMGTNLIQPFWALPLLAVARLDFKDILGFEIIYCATYMLIVTLGLFLW